jgi:hypothetical protein
VKNICLKQADDPDGVDSLWLGQYEDYINHLEEDLIEYARKSSTHLPPSEVSSNTPTAAVIIFELDLGKKDSHGICEHEEMSEPLALPLRVMISAGKALESREMYVRVQSQSQANCSIVYGVQGGLDKYLGSSADSGPFILLEGSCWTQGVNSIRIPLGWTVLSSACHQDFLPLLQPSQQQGTHLSPADESFKGNRCIFRPSYIFEISSSSSPADKKPLSSSPQTQSKSNKFRNNAYVEILGALLRNDRSYFTTTEVRHPLSPSTPSDDTMDLRSCCPNGRSGTMS